MSGHRNRLRFHFIFLCGAAACASASEASPAIAPATIEASGASIAIKKIDGQFARELVEGTLHRGALFELTPGEHNVKVEYRDQIVGGVSLYDFILKSEASHVYKVMYEKIVHDFHRGASVWITDTISGREVGRITASDNEPVTSRTGVLDDGPFFSFLPLAEDNWWVQSRGLAGLLMTKRGQEIQTYRLQIVLYGLPTFQKVEDFVDYIRRERAKPNRALYRLKHLQDEVERSDARAGFCVRTHHVLLDEDGRIEGRFGNTQFAGPMKLESYGYSCRLTQDINRGIDFEYSYQSLIGESDPKLRDRADEAFKRLKF